MAPLFRVAGSLGGEGVCEHMDSVEMGDIRSRLTFTDPHSNVQSFHYVLGEGGGELLRLGFVGQVRREAPAGTVYMSHLRMLKVLNTVIDREEEEEGYSVVRSWLEGDLVLVNVSSFTEPQGAGVVPGSLVVFEVTLHRHDHPHSLGIQREYVIHAHVAEMIRLDDPRVFNRIQCGEGGLRYNPDRENRIRKTGCNYGHYAVLSSAVKRP
ncbi:hypothetical protein B0H14DRAFT_2581282 [Mycena olivaceomarginata]|nr:hypothetical protein B0H14DRAFT_2581282 [Mycena olivaceomarginata]